MFGRWLKPSVDSALAFDEPVAAGASVDEHPLEEAFRAVVDLQLQLFDLEDRLEDSSEEHDQQLAKAWNAVLTVLDDVERLFRGAREEAERNALSGLHRSITRALERGGLKEIEAFGQSVDPRVHSVDEWVPVQPGQDDGIVVEVNRRGFTLADRVVRPAYVNVTKQQAEEGAPS